MSREGRHNDFERMLSGEKLVFSCEAAFYIFVAVIARDYGEKWGRAIKREREGACVIAYLPPQN